MSAGQGEEPGEIGDRAHRTGGRHARPRRRPSGRRRWIVAAGVVAAFTGMVAPPTQSEGLVAVGRVADDVPRSLTARWAIPALSDGAPAGAITLASAPAQTTGPQPTAPADITGLAANGIPNVALNAYRVAAARLAAAKPSCGIDWSLLAGIGRVESNHGRYGGAVLSPDGTASPRMLGPALNGVNFACIGDSDGGRWDGDATYDRAMGPMQFIPATWRSYAIDADGNGATDPFNINDAALAAANYLCVAGGDLRSDAGQRRAVLAYNHSDEYVAEVLALARAYANGIPVADLPIVGDTSGPVPPPSGFYGAPAAPGPAIGARDMTSSPPDRTTGQSPQPAEADAPPAQASPPTGDSTVQPAASSTGSGPAPKPGPAHAPNPGQSPATPSEGRPAPPASAPAPAPLPPPAIPLPLPPPPLPSTVAPLPPTELIPGVTCGLLGLPVCPTG